MPKASLTEDMKKIIADKYEATEPKMKATQLSKWATKELGKPVSAIKCKEIMKTTKRDKAANPERTAFEEFVAFQAKIAFNEQRGHTSRKEVIEIAKYSSMLPFFDKEHIPALTSNWYSVLRDSYGLPKNTKAPTGFLFFAGDKGAPARMAKKAVFRTRPKVLTPYSWKFIEECFLYNWIEGAHKTTNKEFQEEAWQPVSDRIDGKPSKRPICPPLPVYKLYHEKKAPNFSQVGGF